MAEVFSGKALENKKYQEVLFPNRFTNEKPWKSDPEYSPTLHEETIPIWRLSHITHDEQAECIRPSSPELPYTFKPKPKHGKDQKWDGTTASGDTCIEVGEDEYRTIPPEETVFPGFLSWWGIDVREWYEKTTEGQRLLDIVKVENGRWNYVPGYLAEETGSQYGNRGFSIKLESILHDYQRARDQPARDQQARGSADVCLKVGGTLRYLHEICYVVVVCTTEDDLKLGDQKIPNIDDRSTPFIPNGMVNGNGVVVNYDKKPNFMARSILSYENRSYYSWEQLVFAFYFPNSEQELCCTKVSEFEVKRHNPPPKACWKCPKNEC